MSNTDVFTLFEPRWHGFALWTLERREPIQTGYLVVTTLERGWTRRPRNAKKIEAEAIDRP